MSAAPDAQGSFVSQLRCLVCGKVFDEEPELYVCPDHGADGILDVEYDYTRIAGAFSRDVLADDRDDTMWRYLPLLPVRPSGTQSRLNVGWTPLVPTPRVARRHNMATVWIKDEGREPSGSLKDRASAVALERCVASGAPMIAAASTGNAAISLSQLSATLGIDCTVFVSNTLSDVISHRLSLFGAIVIKVNGSYDDAFDECQAACERHGWYNRNTGYNPYMSEGKKRCPWRSVSSWHGTRRTSSSQVLEMVVLSVASTKGCTTF